MTSFAKSDGDNGAAAAQLLKPLILQLLVNHKDIELPAELRRILCPDEQSKLSTWSRPAAPAPIAGRRREPTRKSTSHRNASTQSTLSKSRSWLQGAGGCS